METLADPRAILVIEETAFPSRQGLLRRRPAIYRLGRQHPHCQIGGFAFYVSRHGQAFIDRPRYLPTAWTHEPARLSRSEEHPCELHSPMRIPYAVFCLKKKTATEQEPPAEERR